MGSVVPVIDVSSFVAHDSNGSADRRDRDEDSKSEREEAARRWDEAMSRVGFALIVGHGVDPSLIEELNGGFRKFFEGTDAEYKSSFCYGPYGNPKGGYTAAGREAVARSKDGHGGTEADDAAGADPVESFVCKVPASRCPSMPAEFEKAAIKYNSEMHRVLRCLHRMSEEALGLPNGYLNSYYRPPNTFLVAKYYPPVPFPTSALRYGAHTDYAGFTILKQDDSDGGTSSSGGGLQVWLKGSDEWKPVLPRSDAFVVNLGDLYEDWTNGRWTSAVHRVVAPEPGSEAARMPRMSIPFFTGPHDDAMIETLPTCLPAEGRPERLTSPIRAGDHLMKKLQKTQV